jgi:hypothetical protein
MLSISNAATSSPIETVSAGNFVDHATSNDVTALTTGTTVSLSSSSDLLIGVYSVYSTASGTATLTENGSLTLDQQTGMTPGTSYGQWTGHMALSTNSSSAQAATANQNVGPYTGAVYAIKPGSSGGTLSCSAGARFEMDNPATVAGSGIAYCFAGH